MAEASGRKKVVKSAVCIIPPEHLWGPIQAIRKKHDRAFKRWMPHVNLLYPFYQDTHFPEAMHEAFHSLKHIRPFKVKLRNCTLWLSPESGAPTSEPYGETSGVKAVQAALEAQFPDCDEQGKKSKSGFTPHLSVGQWKQSVSVPMHGISRAIDNSRRHQMIEKAQQQFQAGWKPIEFEVTHVHMISRSGADDPFESKASIPLGGKSAPESFGFEERKIEGEGGGGGKGDFRGRTDGSEGKEGGTGGPSTTQSGGQRFSVDSASRQGVDGAQHQLATTLAENCFVFTYGPDMSPTTLSTRNIIPFMSVLGLLERHSLSMESDKLTLEESLGFDRKVYGVLHELSPEGRRKWLSMVGNVFKHVQVFHNGCPVQAIVASHIPTDAVLYKATDFTASTLTAAKQLNIQQQYTTLLHSPVRGKNTRPSASVPSRDSGLGEDSHLLTIDLVGADESWVPSPVLCERSLPGFTTPEEAGISHPRLGRQYSAASSASEGSKTLADACDKPVSDNLWLGVDVSFSGAAAERLSAATK